jgi:hypothetical protein
LARHGRASAIGVALTITKGDKPRTVYPPIRLLDATDRYIRGPHAAGPPAAPR